MSDDGLSVTFACDEGYTIAGVQEITCSTDGSGWTVTFPNCCTYIKLSPLYFRKKTGEFTNLHGKFELNFTVLCE